MVDDIERRMRDEGLDPSAWSNGPGERYGPHEHAYDKVIVVQRGTIRFGLATTGTFAQPQRRPAGTW